MNNMKGTYSKLAFSLLLFLTFAGAYCVYRRGTGIDRFPLWSFFNLRVFRVSCLKGRLSVCCYRKIMLYSINCACMCVRFTQLYVPLIYYVSEE